MFSCMRLAWIIACTRPLWVIRHTKEEIELFYIGRKQAQKLDGLRKEMYQLTRETHNKEARQEFSAEGSNYYNALLSRVTEEKYPLLHESLKRTGVL